jgi:hypothetical protein
MMTLLCRLIGHKPDFYGYARSKYRRYFRAELDAKDGIGRRHVRIYTTCVRCEAKMQIGMMHMPEPPPKPLPERLQDARDEVAWLEQEMQRALCAALGHDMQHKGGRNAGCADDCVCSVPVHECSRCKACDYGDNAEAAKVIAECEERRS